MQGKKKKDRRSEINKKDGGPRMMKDGGPKVEKGGKSGKREREKKEEEI